MLSLDGKSLKRELLVGVDGVIGSHCWNRFSMGLTIRSVAATVSGDYVYLSVGNGGQFKLQRFLHCYGTCACTFVRKCEI